MGHALTDLLSPARLWSRADILANPCPVPRKSGVYAWYFREIPNGVPHQNCIVWKGFTLLYVGIAPTRPYADGKLPSARTLAGRLREHLIGSSEGSTLRLSLGCLLSAQLGLEMRRVGSGHRMTFGTGEQALSHWMAQNALVTWTLHERPWEIEEHLIHTLSLPLNLAQNRNHPFYPTLSACRAAAKKRARALPVLP